MVDTLEDINYKESLKPHRSILILLLVEIGIDVYSITNSFVHRNAIFLTYHKYL